MTFGAEALQFALLCLVTSIKQKKIVDLNYIVF